MSAFMSVTSYPGCNIKIHTSNQCRGIVCVFVVNEGGKSFEVMAGCEERFNETGQPYRINEHLYFFSCTSHCVLF